MSFFPTIPNKTIERIAQVGYAAKGVLYLIIGALAFQLAVLGGGETVGSKGALKTIHDQPFGRVLMVCMAVGLAAYALWRVIKALSRPEKSDDDLDAKEVVKRGAFLVSAGSHAFLSFVAAKYALGEQSSGGGTSKQEAAQDVMSGNSWGAYLVMAVGCVFIFVAARQFYKAYKPSFLEKLKQSDLSHTKKVWAERIARVGSASRGVTFLAIGGLIISAGWHKSSGKIKGLEGALDLLLEQPYGTWLLAIVAIGLVCYALSCFIKAGYRDVRA